MLGDDVPCEELPVIVIDALDECGGLQHDESGREDLQSLLCTLKRWIQADHLKKFKVVITSRPEDRITFPKSASMEFLLASISSQEIVLLKTFVHFSSHALTVWE